MNCNRGRLAMNTRILSTFLAVFAAMLPIFLAPCANAAEIRIERPSATELRISGGSGARAWHIQYGTRRDYPVIALAGPGSTAYFSHGNWLRQIDGEKGMVTGRWRFPGSSIVALESIPNGVKVEVEENVGRNQLLFRAGSTQEFKSHRVIDFNPAAPQIPYWPTTSLLFNQVPRTEKQRTGGDDIDNLRQWLPEAENAANRDPLSPWLRFELGRIYLKLGRPEALELFKQAIRIESADFRELLYLSGELDFLGQTDAAREAFERGYERFWKKGNDPRMVGTLLGSLITFKLWVPFDVTDESRAELVERTYRFAPWVEGAEFAWGFYADHLERKGNVQEAARWRQRADEARARSLNPFVPYPIEYIMLFEFLLPASLLAALFYVVVLYWQYRPQRRIHKMSVLQWKLTFFNVEYWNRKERIGFLTIVLVAWLAFGAMGSIVESVLRLAQTPIGMWIGTFAGPVSTAVFENLPETPERDLLLAMAYQHDGQTDKAEALYRQLPQFAQSWNNLGALLKDSGRSDPARQAFEKAMELEPEMAEAKLNLNNAPSDLWTELHQKYRPGRAMLAPPQRMQLLNAFAGGSTSKSVVRALAGPLRSGEVFSVVASGIGRWIGLREETIIAWIRIAIIFLVVAVPIALFPRREVAQPPYRGQIVAELLLPGTAPEWRYVAGIVLVSWVYLAVRWIQLFSLTSLFNVPIPSMRAFGVPVDEGAMVELSRPGVPYLNVYIVILFLANAALIWYSRRKRGTD